MRLPATRRRSLPLPPSFVMRYLGLLLAAALGACGDATGAAPIPAGALSVTLAGALAGEYEARGAQPVPATPAPVTFASALTGRPGDRAYAVGGFRARGADRQDVLTLDVRGVSGPGVYPGTGDLVLGLGGDPALPEQVFRITAGTVRVTALSAARIAGEFSGVAVGGAFLPPSQAPPPDTVYLSDGQFDVPIVRR